VLFYLQRDAATAVIMCLAPFSGASPKLQDGVPMRLAFAAIAVRGANPGMIAWWQAFRSSVRSLDRMDELANAHCHRSDLAVARACAFTDAADRAIRVRDHANVDLRLPDRSSKSVLRASVVVAEFDQSMLQRHTIPRLLSH